MKKQKGITLIALVITIIVLLILAGVSISLIVDQNGILSNAQNSVTADAKAKEEEAVKLSAAAAMSISSSKGNIALENGYFNQELKNEFGEGNYLLEEQEDKFIVTIVGTGNSYEVDKFGDTFAQNPDDENDENTIANMFDATGEIEGKLHIGDFVNYSAGVWTTQEISALGLNVSSGTPYSAFEFGGFTAGKSRDENAQSLNSYYFAKDKSTNQPISGWRVLDVENGAMTLISSGCTEEYYVANYFYHPDQNTHVDAINEYILTGVINPNVSSLQESDLNSYTVRDWSMYVNPQYGATSAKLIHYTDLCNWLAKYLNASRETYYGEVDVSSVLYGTRYETLIDCGNTYTLGKSGYLGTNQYNSNGSLFIESFGIANAEKHSLYQKEAGIRVVVTIPSNIKISTENIETKTVVSNKGNEYSYNVWDFEQ